MGSRFAAIHEAGHTVAAYRAGLRTKRVTIVSDGIVDGFHEAELPCHRWPRRKHDEWDIIVILAGYAAEVRLDPARGEYRRLAACSDFTIAGALVDMIHKGKKVDEAFAAYLDKARRFVDGDWPAICLIADQLLEHRILDSLDVGFFMHLADGERLGWKPSTSRMSEIGRLLRWRKGVMSLEEWIRSRQRDSSAARS